MHSPSDLTLLLIQVVVILGVARALHWAVGRRVGQPLVVSEIAAGVVLGPSVLGALSPSLAGQLFAASSLPTLSVVSKLGVVLFAFLVGLELDPNLLRQRARVPVVVGLAGLLAPATFGLLAGAYLHAEHGGDTHIVLFAVFLGVAMSISAFPVLARILAEHRALNASLGGIAMASAAVTDLVAWCVLAIVVAVARFETGWRGALVTVAAALGLLVLSRATRPLFARLEARPTDTAHDSMVVAAVMMSFAAVATAELLGLHGLLVAFFMGLLIPRSRATDALIERLESLVVLVLLPLFFASSGLRTDLRFVGSDGVVLLVLVGLGMLVKVGGVFVAARSVGVASRDALRLGVLLDARGLFGLIVLNVGLQIGVISPRLFTMLVVMTWVTTVLVTPLLKLLDRGEAARPPPARAIEPTPRGGVLVHLADAKLLPGFETLLGALARGDASLRRVAGLHLRPPREAASVRAATSSPSPMVADFDALVERAGLEGRAISYVSTRPADDLVRTAETKGASLILLGARRPSLFDDSVGGLVREVQSQSRYTVAVLAKGDGLLQVREVLLAYGADQEEREALRLAGILRDGGARVRVLRASAPEGEGSALGPQWDAADVEWAEHDTPVEALLTRLTQRPPDLLVVGFSKFWGVGSSSQRPTSLLARSPVPTLVVRTGDGTY